MLLFIIPAIYWFATILSDVLFINRVIAIKIDLTTNSTIMQHIMIVYRFIC
jgi:hypothetical protein